MTIRPASAADLDAVAAQMHDLWPDGSVEEHRAHAEALVAGKPPSTLPLVLFVAEEQGAVQGFVEVGLRSHADGCDATRPVGFLEGWYVVPARRRQGVGRALLQAAERWAREQGCVELASDTWIDHPVSEQAHLAYGFEVVDRCVHLRKAIG